MSISAPGGASPRSSAPVVGGSYNKLSGFRDDGVRYSPGLSNSVAYFADNGKWNFAWAAHAGLAYKVNPGFTVELAYSYMNLGDAAPGNFRAFDDSVSGPTTDQGQGHHLARRQARRALGAQQPAGLHAAAARHQGLIVSLIG